MVETKNELIYIIRQIIGNEEPDGFYTYVENNSDIIKVPNYLFKDAPAEYPEIRISPFLEDKIISNPLRIKKYDYNNKYVAYRAKFQIDIFATNIAQINQIYDEIFRRIDLAYEIEHVTYGYTNDFVEIYPNIYVNKKITSKYFKFNSITIGHNRINIVDNKEDFNNNNNVYLLNNNGLYVHTLFDIKRIRMRSIINGLLLPDGNSIHSKGIVKLSISDKTMLSDLKRNNVERISFMLNIVYGMDNIRKPGPIATHIQISDYHGR